MRKTDWNLEQVLNTMVKGQYGKSPLSPNFGLSDFEANESTLSHCLIIAFIIENHGDNYLPILERLNNELDSFYRLNQVKKLAFHLSKDHSLENLNQLQSTHFIGSYVNNT